MITASDAVASAFTPHEALALELMPTLGPAGSDGSHDQSHIIRVWRNAAAIAATEPACDTELLAAAVMLHDCVAVEKDSTLRPHASRLSAEHARALIAPLQWPPARIEGLVHAIKAHSFSARIPPGTLEARILQDADRLDAIGAIGIARCFYVGGRMGSALYDLEDPDASVRPLDDRRFAFDHFAAKLFRLGSGFMTAGGRAMAAERIATMERFVTAFRSEVAG